MPVFSGQNREQLRQMYLDAWRKYTAHQPLEPLEAQVAAVIAEHPEYVPLLESGAPALAADYTPEGGQANPFLHMGLHLAHPRAGRHQPSRRHHADPPGARPSASATRTPPSTRCSRCWRETLWESQRAGRVPDEQRYLERLRAL